MAAISVVAGGGMLIAHAYGICVRFYCISLKYIYVGGGYNASKGLISRDSAKLLM